MACGEVGIGNSIGRLYQNDLLLNFPQDFVTYPLVCPISGTCDVEGFGTLALGTLYWRSMCLMSWLRTSRTFLTQHFYQHNNRSSTVGRTKFHLSFTMPS